MIIFSRKRCKSTRNITSIDVYTIKQIKTSLKWDLAFEQNKCFFLQMPTSFLQVVV